MWSLFYRQTKILITTICLIVVGGIFAWQLIPRMEDPQLSQWYSFVLTPYPGASAQRVESLVTDKIEQELLEIEAIKTIRSTSSIGNSFIVVELKNEVQDFAEVWSRVRDRLADVAPQLPPETSEPEYKKVSQTAYTFIVGLSWNLDSPPNYAILRRSAKQLQNELRSIPGTQEVELFSEPEEEITVAIDPADLAALNLTPQELSQQIRLSDAKVPTGRLYNPDHKVLLEVEDELDSVARIEQIPLRVSNSGQFARLGDVASVTKGIQQPPSELALIDGQPGLAIAMRIESSQPIEQWTEEVYQTLEQYRQRSPVGIKLAVILDQNLYVTKRLDSLFKNLLFGALLVLIATGLMMGWRSGLVVGATLPLSVLMVLGGMQLMDIPLHQISVTGLIIALGMLIDNGIVVVDEIQRALQRGIKPQAAIEQTVSYLAVPLFASNLTSILTFVPIVLLPGDVGEFVGTLAISVILALISSFFLSLTVIPALTGKIHRQTTPKNAISLTASLDPKVHPLGRHARQHNFWTRGFSHPCLRDSYGSTLRFILARPILGIFFALILPVTGFLMASTLPEQFFPPAERDQFQIELELSALASINKTQSVAQDARTVILQHPEVKNVHWFLGNRPPEFYYNLPRSGLGQVNHAYGIVQLVSAKPANRIIAQLQTELDIALPAARVLVRRLEQGPYISAPIEIRIYGGSLKVLKTLGKKVNLLLAQTPGISHTRASLSAAVPKLALRLDEERIKLTDLDRTAISRQLNASLEGSLGGSIIECTEELPVRVRMSDRDRGNLDQITTLDLLPNSIQTGAGQPAIPLSALGKLELVPEIATVSRRNGKRLNLIQGFITNGVLPATVLRDFQARFETLNLEFPPGYSIEFGGESEKRNRTLGSLISIVSVLLILMLATLAIAFNSFSAAGIIVLVSISSIGLGLFSLWCFGYPFGFTAILGTVGLAGV
ncbi:MAG: efflux RND transporter permease subunit, partial [Cyanobacteria bacterium J06600_6]